MTNEEKFFTVLSEATIAKYKDSILFHNDAVEYVFTEFQKRINSEIAKCGEEFDNIEELRPLLEEKKKFNEIFKKYFYDY